MTSYVYTLRHPERKEAYVGKANDPALRFREHLKCALVKNHRDPKYRWIRRMAGEGVTPVLVVESEYSTEEEAYRRESSHRDALAAQGWKLYNCVGAPVGIPFEDERRKKISVARTGKPLSEEHRAALSAAHRGKPLSAKTRASLSAALLGKPKTAAHCAAISAGQRGKQISATHRAALSVAHTGRSLSLAHRAAISAGLKKMHESRKHPGGSRRESDHEEMRSYANT